MMEVEHYVFEWSWVSHYKKNNVFKICTLAVPDDVIFQNGRLNKKKTRGTVV